MNQNYSDAGSIKSMTAFGRAVASFAYGRFTVEIQSVNRRFLEINVSVPRLFNRFELDIRKSVSESIGRGMVNVTLMCKTEAKQPISVTPNLPLARGIKQAWEILAKEFGMDTTLPVALIAEQESLLIYEEELVDEEIYRAAIKKALHEALQALIAIKREEGAALAKDLIERLKLVRTGIDFIASNANVTVQKYRLKLTERVEELFAGNVENEERILREIALYAERIDITEEIVRSKSHLDQFEKMLETPLENILETRGKNFEFLLQELLREVNTIGSKSSELEISQQVVKLKSELEKVREQVQNIE